MDPPRGPAGTGRFACQVARRSPWWTAGPTRSGRVHRRFEWAPGLPAQGGETEERIMVRGSAPPHRWLVGSAHCVIPERRALVRTSQEESAKDAARLKTAGFIPPARMAIWERRQGSAMNACGALDPAPRSRGYLCAPNILDNADDFIDGLRPRSCRFYYVSKRSCPQDVRDKSGSCCDRSQSAFGTAI